MRSPQTGPSAAPARWSMPATACRGDRGCSCRPLPWSRRARISCRAGSCRYPSLRMQGAFAGVDQVHYGQSFPEGADRIQAFDRGKVHGLVALVALAWIFMNLAIDGEPSACDVSL